MEIRETVYMLWKVKNEKNFAGINPSNELWKEIRKIVAARCARDPLLQNFFMKCDGRV